MTLPVFLHGLGIKNYKGVGSDRQFCRAFTGMNFFVGPNNAGKSCLLDFIAKQLPKIKHSNDWPAIDQEDRFLGGAEGRVEALIAEPLVFATARCNDAIKKNNGTPILNRGFIETLLRNVAGHEDVLWHAFAGDTQRSALYPEVNLEAIQSVFPNDVWQTVWGGLTSLRGGSPSQWIADTVKFISLPTWINPPQANLVPAIRQISASNNGLGFHAGEGLIDRLAAIQSPDHDRQPDKETFNRINHFLKIVTDTGDARIEIPHNRKHVLVQMQGRVFPLHYLGTGIHEIIMLAAFCTLSSEQIICLEEPEIHLHPILQRKLIRYLLESTDNQYFIATHSPCFIDTPGTSIFHVTHDGKQTRVSSVSTKANRHLICQSLGYKASDLVQASAVVWVEGPSDRIYLNHWIRALDETLIEGIHYSVMFYGGRLLSHLSAQDGEISEFIELRNLNRNFVIIIDSDKTCPEDDINETKKRIIADVQNDGVAWLTEGREIENYLPAHQVASALKHLYKSRFLEQVGAGKYDHVLSFYTKDDLKLSDDRGKVFDKVDKVKIARHICAEPPDFNVLNLFESVRLIIEFIRKGNHLPSLNGDLEPNISPD